MVLTHVYVETNGVKSFTSLEDVAVYLNER